MKLVNQKEGIYQSFKKKRGGGGVGRKKRKEINQQAGMTPKPTSINLKYALEWKNLSKKNHDGQISVAEKYAKLKSLALLLGVGGFGGGEVSRSSRSSKTADWDFNDVLLPWVYSF